MIGTDNLYGLVAGRASHTTLANSTATADGLHYQAAGPGLGPDRAPQGGGHLAEGRGQPAAAAAVLARPERIEVRAPWFDVRWVLRDWNGMGSLDDFAQGAKRIGVVRANNNRNSEIAGLPFDVSTTLARGATVAWDAGTEAKARPGTWW